MYNSPMHQDSLPYVIPLLSVIALAVLLSLYLFRERKHTDIKVLLSVILLASGWAAGYSLEMLSADIESKIGWATVQYPFICLLPVAWYAFAIRMAGLTRLLAPKYLLLLCVIPLAMQPIIWSNDWHHLFWRDIRLIQEGPFLLLDIDYGPAFWVNNTYAILLVGVSTLYLISVASFTRKLHLTQRIVMITIPLLPAIANILYTQRIGPIPNLDLTPFAFLLAGLILAYGFVLYQLDRVVLVARGDVLDKLPQAIFVLDNLNCLLDANQSARRLCSIDIKQFYGKGFADIPDPLLKLISQPNILSLNGVEISHTEKTTKEEETFLVSATEIEELSQSIGLVLMLTNISEQKRANDLLISAQDAAVSARIEAEAANRAKSEFLSQMSHELRTPLNAVLGFSHIMLQDAQADPLNEQQKKFLGHIENGGKHLVKLIDDILSLATVDAGKVSLEQQSIEPLLLVDECVGLMRPLAEKRKIIIRTDQFLDTNVNIAGDRVRVKQVILNLLSNAIKYNRENGSVEVLFSPSENADFRISVKDSGPGIEEKLQSGLFLPFSRLGMENSDIDGTGIGLALSKKLIELMSGRIGFVSQKGHGSTFWFELPLSEPGQGNISEKTEPIAENIHPRISNKRILYIEDNALNLSLMRSVVETIDGVNLISAETAEHGLEIIQSDPPDMVLMDINLPGISGIEALKKLKANPHTRNIPVVAVSAAVMEKDKRIGMEAGFVHYLTKPLDIGKVVSTIRQILA